MNTQKVDFQFISGLKRTIFRNARLRGSWDDSGRYSDNWTEAPMQEEMGNRPVMPTFSARSFCVSGVAHCI